MGNYLGRLTGRSGPYTVLLLLVAARHTARALKRGAAVSRGSLLHHVARLVGGQSWPATLVGDWLGLVLAWRLLGAGAAVRDFARLPGPQKYDYVGAVFFNLLKNTPLLSYRLAREARDMEAGLRKTLKDPLGNLPPAVSALPLDGRAPEAIIAEVDRMVSKEDPKWKEGWCSGSVYHGQQDHLDMMNTVSCKYTLSNPLHPDVWPSLRKMEAEIVAMCASMLNGGDAGVCGCITSGGTESIFMAVKTHRERGLRERGITAPELIIPATAHAAFDKAAECLRVKLVKLPVDPATFQVDPALVRRRITGNTVLIVGSAPNYPQGTIDRIRELSDVALATGVGLHVDCCLGGFILPFAKEAGYPVPDFDFSLPGVTSISCDTHKYGFASKGTSVVLYRNKQLRRHQYWTYADWTGGLYCTPTMAGSRPGALSAACWASMMRMGRAGYVDATRKILATREKIQRAIDGIQGIAVMGQPPAMVVAWDSESLNVYKMADRMSKKGWSINSLQKPASVHICVTYPHTQNGVADRFIADLTEVVVAMRRERDGAGGAGQKQGKSKKDDGGGSAPIYGMTAALPKGPINQMLWSYIDVSLEV